MTCLLSFDIEDWFHAHNLSPAIQRDEWEECEPRVETNTRRILDLLEKHETRATFFILGWVADRHPELVKAIGSRGHEIASHGYNHKLLYNQSKTEVLRDLRRSLDVLGSLTEQEISGYRAPSFSITHWATDLLNEMGFSYDSSSFAFSGHDRYGQLNGTGEGTFTTLPNGLVEARLPQLEVFKLAIPWAGGGYFRMLPYPVFRRGVDQIQAERPFIFYLHPWDLDPSQPRLRNIPWSYRIRHYTNLDKSVDKLDRLLADFTWEPIETMLSSG